MNLKKAKSRLALSVVLLLLILAIALTAAYAWFSSSRAISTATLISNPDDIAILNADESNIEFLNFYSNIEDVGENTKAVRRVVCVKTTKQNFLMEIAHTTNIAGLTFALYPATLSAAQTPDTPNVAYVVDGVEEHFTYATSSPITGSYINKDAGAVIANGTFHGATYDEYAYVKPNAEPLYWLSDTQTSQGTQQDGYYINYYVLVALWTEDKKETDIVYLLAKTTQG